MVFDFEGLRCIQDWFFCKITFESKGIIEINLDQLKDFEECCDTYNTYLKDTPMRFRPLHTHDYRVHYSIRIIHSNLYEIEYWCKIISKCIQ